MTEDEDRITVTPYCGFALYADGTTAKYERELGKWVVVEEGSNAKHVLELLNKFTVVVKR